VCAQPCQKEREVWKGQLFKVAGCKRKTFACINSLVASLVAQTDGDKRGKNENHTEVYAKKDRHARKTSTGFLSGAKLPQQQNLASLHMARGVNTLNCGSVTNQSPA
jgi:hypothetical protein